MKAKKRQYKKSRWDSEPTKGLANRVIRSRADFFFNGNLSKLIRYNNHEFQAAKEWIKMILWPQLQAFLDYLGNIGQCILWALCILTLVSWLDKTSSLSREDKLDLRNQKRSVSVSGVSDRRLSPKQSQRLNQLQRIWSMKSTAPFSSDSRLLRNLEYPHDVSRAGSYLFASKE